MSQGVAGRADARLFAAKEPPRPNRHVGYATSAASFIAKGGFAFVITYSLANTLAPFDFALWSTLFSLGAILGITELGVGQHVVTTFHERREPSVGDSRFVAECVAAMLLLAVAMSIVAAVAFRVFHVLEAIPARDLLLTLILARLVTVPYGAYLLSLERHHERKAVEAAAYGISALFVLWAVQEKASLGTLLVGMNIILTLNSFVIVARARALGFPRLDMRGLSFRALASLLKLSFPYFVNNVSSLATYAGFIALSALVLRPEDVARLALLHNLLLMHTYQLFELAFRQVQPRINDPILMRRLQMIIGASFALALVLCATIGVWLFSVVFHKYEYTVAELSIYSAFVFLEVAFLLLTTAMQMRSAMKSRVMWLSIAKAGAFALLLIVAAVLGTPSLLTYTALLVVYDAVIVAATSRARLAPLQSDARLT